MANTNSKKKKTSPAKKDTPNFYHVYLNIPEEQYLTIKATALKMGCTEVNDYLRKLLALGEVTSRTVEHGWDMAVFDKTKAKLIENEKTGGVALLIDSNKDIAVVTTEVQKIFDMDKKIENSTTLFGVSPKTYRA
jgi:hypothetical protein